MDKNTQTDITFNHFLNVFNTSKNEYDYKFKKIIYSIVYYREGDQGGSEEIIVNNISTKKEALEIFNKNKYGHGYSIKESIPTFFNNIID